MKHLKLDTIWWVVSPQNPLKESKEILLNLFKDPNKANIRELAKQIETGELKLDNKELQEVLIEITKKKISVDNPKYSTYKKLIE